MLAVAGIVGTTEESGVDPLDEIFKLKEEFSKKGLYFHFHIDGAYGGYFVSMIRNRFPSQVNSYSDFVEKQLQMFGRSDSITFDPHKTGYVPYTCGGIIYRNHRLRDNLSFSAPYIYTGAEPNMAIYGIEGSKPGSSVTSVYLSLQVLPLVRSGHGELLERTLMNTKIFTASLYGINDIKFQYDYVTEKGEKKKLVEKFGCYMLPRLYCEKTEKPELRKEEMQAIKQIAKTSPLSLKKMVKEHNWEQYYLNLGPDLNILCYCVNFTNADGSFNRSLKQ